ncbi:hypothetical protein BDV96DRAFT_684971 [Lophiotrema nucula]|uniref:XPA C-terminal domain-containing protein n=1 Tax=Lophiotrema nucula TaxID=690887 RepID=A0A6A5ZGU5_9PLEO|nr:hypothetical protein BDV96DRAFT_684971 [Lophiotrema nucula]
MASGPHNPPQSPREPTLLDPSQSLPSPISSQNTGRKRSRSTTPDETPTLEAPSLPTPKASPNKRQKKEKTASQLAKEAEKAAAKKAKEDEKATCAEARQEEDEDTWHTTQKCKDYYKLSPAELACLPRLEKMNPQSYKFAPMKLYRVRDVARLAFQKAAVLGGLPHDDEEEQVLEVGRRLFEEEHGPLEGLAERREVEKGERMRNREDGGEDPGENNFYMGPWRSHSGKLLH